jgi:hypothetical protein
MRARERPVSMRCLLGFCSSHLSYGVVNDTIDLLERRKRTLRLRHVKLSRIKSVMSRSHHHMIIDALTIQFLIASCATSLTNHCPLLIMHASGSKKTGSG